MGKRMGVEQLFEGPRQVNDFGGQRRLNGSHADRS
jgi:hypothetical protein